MNNLVSIIVPIYNSEKYLKDCIDSLCNQSHSDIEIILVNDGSTDSSSAICDDFSKKDSRIKVIHTKNNGVSSARNCGIDNAVGDYIMFCDSDDKVSPDWVSELVACAKTYPDRMPLCGIVYFPVLGEPEYRKLPKNLTNTNKYLLFDLSGLITMSYSYIVYNPVNKIYQSDIIKQNNLRFDTNNSLGEDAVFNMDYLYFLNGKSVYVDEILYYYQGYNPGSLRKVDYRAYAESYEKIYNAYYDLFKKLDALDAENTAALHSYHYSEILSTALNAVRDNTLSKKQRMKEFKRFIYLPAFNKCRKLASHNQVGDIKLLKLSKCRFLLILYIWYVEIFRK